MRVDLVELLRPSVDALGYEFWGLELLGGGKRSSLLRIYIDTDNGVGVDDCEIVSRQLSRVLDVEDPIHGEYRLEISSPGLERPFFYPEQYVHYCGEMISVKTQIPIEGQRNFKGILNRVVDDKIVVEYEGREVGIEFANIQKAHLISSVGKK